MSLTETQRRLLDQRLDAFELDRDPGRPAQVVIAEIRHRRERARALRAEAEQGWADAKRRFEEQLLGPAP